MGQVSRDEGRKRRGPRWPYSERGIPKKSLLRSLLVTSQVTILRKNHPLLSRLNTGLPFFEVEEAGGKGRNGGEGGRIIGVVVPLRGCGALKRE